MAAVSADLGQRIAGSAKGLASSAFSGASGAEAAEVHTRWSWSLGKGSAELGQSSHRGLIPIDFSRHVAVEESKAQSFRSSSGWVKDVEREYESFVSGASISSTTGVNIEDWVQPLERGEVRTDWESLWTQRSSAGLSAGPQSVVPETTVQLDGTIPIWERSSRGEVVYKDDSRPEWKWRHEWKRINKHVSRELSEQRHRSANGNPFELEVANRMGGMEAGRYDLQSSALARLHLLKEHLSFSKPENDHMHSWKQDWEMQQHDRCDWTVERESDNLPPNQEEPDEEADRYYFHCPWRDCHHRLLRQNENLTLDIRQRACVHQDCGYVSDKVESWLKHVTSKHHNPASVHRGKGDDRSQCDCASSDKSEVHADGCTGGVWLVRSKSKTKLDIRLEPCHDARAMHKQLQTYERWSTEMRLVDILRLNLDEIKQEHLSDGEFANADPAPRLFH